MNYIERRIKRYKITYVWKTLEAMVPENGVCLAPESERKGRLFKTPSLNPGLRVFNCLTRKLRNSTNYTLEEFKEQLDYFLSGVQGGPKICGLMPWNFEQSNILVTRREKSNVKNIG